MNLEETSVAFAYNGKYRCLYVWATPNGGRANITEGQIYIAKKRYIDRDSIFSTSYLEIEDDDGRKVIVKESCMEYVH